MDTRKLLEELENVIDSATEVPFSNKKMVDKDEIERLIDAINQSLPNELESARRIVADKERILLDAEKIADDTIAQAKDYIARITEVSELVKQAQETEGVTEGLKEENPMLWVQKMNTITAGAQEMVLNEIIYS